MFKPPKVTDLQEMIDELSFIGNHKNDLPIVARGWINAAGLYVQYRLNVFEARLEAGGKYHSCFDATTKNFADEEANSWKVRRFDKDAWSNQFAHLVYPTHEIVVFLTGDPYKPPIDFSDGYHFNAINNAVQYFEKTGEWVGLFHQKCKSCSKEVPFWIFPQRKLCPYCNSDAGNLRD